MELILGSVADVLRLDFCVRSISIRERSYDILVESLRKHVSSSRVFQRFERASSCHFSVVVHLLPMRNAIREKAEANATGNDPRKRNFYYTK